MARRRRFHRVRHHVGGALRGGKATATGALIGAVAAFGIGKTAEHVQFVRDNWYAPPGLLIALGHFLKRKHPNVGASMIGAGGAIGYYGYALSHGGAQGDADSMPVDPGEAGDDAGEAYQGNAGDFDAYERIDGSRALAGTATGQVSPDAGDDVYHEAGGLQGG